MIIAKKAAFFQLKYLIQWQWSQDGGIRSPSREGLAGRSPKEDPNFAYPAAHDELVCGASKNL